MGVATDLAANVAARRESAVNSNPEERISMSAEQPPVGIDLGTTYSLVAYLDDTGRPVTVPNEQGDLLTPSAVFVDEDDIIVGKEAVKASVVRPQAYAECFKRDMGSVAFRRNVCDRQVPPEVLSRPWYSNGSNETRSVASARCGVR